jgi:hypothetical protein
VIDPSVRCNRTIGKLFPIYGKIQQNDPNHQPVEVVRINKVQFLNMINEYK